MNKTVIKTVTGIFAAAGMILAASQVLESEPQALRPVVERVVEQAIIPSYRQFKAAAQAQYTAIAALCAHPDAAGLSLAKDRFRDLALSWSSVEMFHFGPAINEHRYERVFYWPDIRGRGLKQVKSLIRNQDDSVFSVQRLQQKSIAVQGLPALEFLLFDISAQWAGRKDSFECRYALSIADNLKLIAANILQDWQTPSRFVKSLLEPCQENELFMNHEESFTLFLKYINQQLEVLRDLKIGGLFNSKGRVRAKRAPFWRSDLTLVSYAANLKAVKNTLDIMDLAPLLPQVAYQMDKKLTAHLGEAAGLIETLGHREQPFIELMQSSSRSQVLQSVVQPLSAAIKITAEHYPAVLKLTLGFNARDGD